MSRPIAGCTVLVTGANGFVGPHLARALTARGAQVIGAALGDRPAEPSVVAWHSMDLASPESVQAAWQSARPDFVVHLAGQSSAARSFEAPAETFEANVLGTLRMLQSMQAVAPKARMLVVGTSEVYGGIEADTRAKEDSPQKPVSPYALSKCIAERLAAEYAEQHRLDVVRVRPFGHTGPGQTPRFVIASFAQQIAAIEAGNAEPVLRVGNLQVTRDLTDVRDIVEGYCSLLERGHRGEVYNLCRGEGVLLSQVADSLAAMAKVEVHVEVDPARLRPADVPYLVGDPSRVQRDTGWQASRPLEQTLKDVLHEWRGVARGQV